MELFNNVRLSDVEHGRNNNLNLIRLGLASGVVFSHSYPALNQEIYEPTRRFLHLGGSIGDICVFGFFFISGFLILKSALRRPDPSAFLWARVLRIFPALIITVLLSVFVIGPIVTRLPLSIYFHQKQTYAYLGKCALNPHASGDLPGVFVTNSKREVNLPLWTLSSEWAMYLAAFLFALMLRLRSVRNQAPLRSWIVLGIFLLFTLQMFPLPLQYAYKWALFFILGSTAYLGRDRIVLSFSLALPALMVDLVLMRFVPVLGKIGLPFALTYFLLVAGFHPALFARWFTHLGDFSYGIYIYGWIVEQVLAQYFSSPLSLFLASIFAVLPIAMFSWYFVESPSLSLKNREIPLRATEIPAHVAA